MESILFREAVLGLHVMKSFAKPLRIDFARLIQSVGAPVEVPLGETWLHQGNPDIDSGYVLIHGTAEIERDGRTINVCDAPELFGEIKQFNADALRSASVTAKTKCVLLKFDWNGLWEEAEKSIAKKDLETLRSVIEFYAWERLA